MIDTVKRPPPHRVTLALVAYTALVATVALVVQLLAGWPTP